MALMFSSISFLALAVLFATEEKNCTWSLFGFLVTAQVLALISGLRLNNHLLKMRNELQGQRYSITQLEEKVKMLLDSETPNQ